MLPGPLTLIQQASVSLTGSSILELC